MKLIIRYPDGTIEFTQASEVDYFKPELPREEVVKTEEVKVVRKKRKK